MQIIAKYTNNIVCAAGHDQIWSAGVDELVEKGITLEDANVLRRLSCSHGAGRVMGRKQAIQELDLIFEQNFMKDIIHNIHSKKQLDEAPSAYKDINVVMANQKDLVEISVELTPLAVIKEG